MRSCEGVRRRSASGCADPADYALITRRLLERLAAQNVRYAEIIIAAGVVLWKGQEFAPIFDAIAEAAAGSPVEVRWIFDAVRQFGVEQAQAGRGVGGGAAGPRRGRVRDRRQRGARSGGVVRRTCSRSPSARACTWSRMRERAPVAQSIRAALGLGRSGSGTGSRRSRMTALMRHLRERDIPLEVCVTSNLVTGVVKSVEEHPVRRLYDAGVPITLNTDDPAMFRCTLVGEYELASAGFGFTRGGAERDRGERVSLCVPAVAQGVESRARVDYACFSARSPMIGSFQRWPL